jgi:hypothetical protein
MLDVSFAQPDLWDDKMKRRTFNESLEKILSFNPSKWQKMLTNLRVWASYISYYLHKGAF